MAILTQAKKKKKTNLIVNIKKYHILVSEIAENPTNLNRLLAQTSQMMWTKLNQ